MRPKFLGLIAVVVLAAALCVQLSQWQWSRAQPDATRPFSNAKPVDLTTILKPGAPFTSNVQGRPVNATGAYDASKQVLVAGRHFSGRDGYIVVSPLKLNSSGAYLAVARGWVTSPDAAPAPPRGQVTVSGLMVLSEAGANTILPQGQVAAIATSLLLNEWGGSIYTGYLVPPTTTPGLNPMPVPALTEDTGFNLENVSYAIQWIVFGAFGFFIWFRQVRDTYNEEREAAEAAADAELEAAAVQTTSVTGAEFSVVEASESVKLDLTPPVHTSERE